jgi:predicted lipoprotein
VGCQDDEDGGGNACGSNFDQTAMLTAYADELIVPAFNELNESTNNLLAASDAFLETTDAANLSRLRAEIQSLYLNYVDKEMLQIGPAEDVDLQSVMNPFPVNEDIVLSLLENGIENHVFGFDRGLPALEFLFFGPYEDDQLIALFENRNFNAGSRAYLSFVVGSMQESVATVTEAWNGNYRTDFIANTGTAAGSSVSQLVNALNEQWERTKRDRLGIPAGIATLGITNPETVEAPYIGNSLELLAATIQGSKRMFQIGLDDYLDFVNAQKSGTPLTTLINNQYDLGTAAVAGLPGPLSSTVDEMPDAVANAYAELVRNIVLLKTDLPSVLCVAITYVDNPSDSD